MRRAMPKRCEQLHAEAAAIRHASVRGRLVGPANPSPTGTQGLERFGESPRSPSAAEILGKFWQAGGPCGIALACNPQRLFIAQGAWMRENGREPLVRSLRWLG